MLAATTCSSVQSTRGAPREPARARQHRADPRHAIVVRPVHRDPVADGRKVRSCARLVPQPSRHSCEPLLPTRQHTVDVRVLEAHARRRESCRCVRPEGLRTGIVPAPAPRALSLQVTLHCKVISGRLTDTGWSRAAFRRKAHVEEPALVPSCSPPRSRRLAPSTGVERLPHLLQQRGTETSRASWPWRRAAGRLW